MELLDDLLFQRGYIDGITILNLEGEILFSAKFNKKLSSLDESQQLVGQNFLDVYENLTPQSSTLYRAMELGRPIYEEKQYLKKRGKDGIVITSLSFPIKNNGRIVGAIDLSTQEPDETDTQDLDCKIELGHNIFQREQTQKLSSCSSACFQLEDIIAVNPQMRQAKDYIRVVASCDLPVMLCGETGTGKDVFAQAIHNVSARRKKPFIAQNCAAIPDTLLESILFGTAKGAFTGAIETKGLLELADGGTLFLDELNSMPLYLQSKLLRVLQDGTFRKLGASEVKTVDVKLIAALNQDPLQEIARGRLRQDVYYRLSVMSIKIPPLRERREDIQAFVETYVKKHNQTFQKNIRYISHELLQKLREYPWPGNVRELEHIVVYGMSVVSPEADTLTFADVEKKYCELSQVFSSDREILPQSLTSAVDGYEKKLIQSALRQAGGNISKAARILDIPRQTLQRKMKQYSLEPGVIQPL